MDLITSDHRMPVFSAPAALAVAFEVRPDLPLIVVSGEGNLNLAVSLMRAGAQDYIQKEEMDRLVPTIKRVLLETDLREQRREIAKALQISEASYRQHFETAQEGILILDAETGQIRDINPFLTDLLGYSREQCFGKKLWEIGAFKDSVASQAEFVELKTRGYIRYENLPLKTRDGRAIDVECIGNLYVVNDLRVIQCYIRVITDRVARAA